MQEINTVADLKSRIQQLEQQQAIEWPLLKEDLHKTYESFKLINILKSTFKEAVDVPDIKTNIINAAIGLTSGIVAKKVILGKTLNPLSKLLGLIVEVVVSNKVAKNADGIKTIGSVIMKKLFNQKDEREKV
ncbi:MAG: hypothetical protein ABI666_06840 [Ferruginibacter sp.]